MIGLKKPPTTLNYCRRTYFKQNNETNKSELIN